MICDENTNESASFGGAGVLDRPLVRMESAYGNILGRGGSHYLGSLCMTLEMVLKCYFGLIVGVGHLLSLPAILNYIG